MELNDESFMLFAAKHYDMMQASSTEDFIDDVKRFQYLKRLFRRFVDHDELRAQLILNHIIVIYNCFGPIATDMLFMQLSDYHQSLKPFVLFLNYLPKTIRYNGQTINTTDIAMNQKVIEELRKIKNG